MVTRVLWVVSLLELALNGQPTMPKVLPHHAKPLRRVEAVMRGALALLPDQPAYVSVIDVDAQEDARVREVLRSLEAFTLPGRAGVYINLQSWSLQQAMQTVDDRIYRFDIHVLAAIVWHEMAHIAGENESLAQAHEEKLWKTFLRDGGVETDAGLRQLQIYASRRLRREPTIDTLLADTVVDSATLSIRRRH